MQTKNYDKMVSNCYFRLTPTVFSLIYSSDRLPLPKLTDSIEIYRNSLTAIICDSLTTLNKLRVKIPKDQNFFLHQILKHLQQYP